MRKHLEILPIVAALLLAPAAAWAGLPRELTDALRQMQERRAAAPVFAETFTRDLRQWGFALPLGPEGLVLDRAAGTVPGVRQIFIPGLLLRDGVVTCEMRIARDDQGYLMFRADEDADAAYQLILSTRPDGKFPSGFVKKRTLNLLYGGSLVGQSYRGVFPAEEWISVEVYFAGRNLVAVANGEPVAFYDRADTRDGCISVFNGAQPLGLRNLRAYTFQGEEPVSAYRPPRAGGDADPVLLGPPTDGLLAFPPSAFPPAGAGRAMDNGLVGALPRPGGATFSWRLDAKNKFFLDGEELIPLRTTDGVYFAQLPADVAQLRALESIRDGDLIDQIRASGLPFTPVRVRLVDYVNALGTDHDFREDPVLGGRTRILEIAGRRCRVTSPRRWLSYFSYTMGAGQPLAPHLLLAQTPNDRERNLVLRVHPPAGADADYAVGAGTFAGRGVACDGRLFHQALLFTPRTRRVRLTISHMPAEEGFDRANGAAVSQLFLFSLVDGVTEAPNPVLAPAGGERVLALSVPSARALLRQRGSGLDAPDAAPADREAAYRGILHALRFLGFNGLDVGVVDVGDREVAAEFAGGRALATGVERGVFAELLPLAESAGIQVTPVLPPLALAGLGAETPDWSLVDCAGQACRVGLWPALDLLHAGPAQRFADLLTEVAERCRGSAAVRQIAVRVEGDAGNCIPRAGARRPEEVGFGPEDVSRFASETGLPVPTGSAEESFQWLREHAWDRWTQWRCEAFYMHWLRARNLLRGVDPSWRLVLKTALPDRDLSRAATWFVEGTPPLDLLRAHGFDPTLFAGSRGVVLERSFDLGFDRTRAFRHRENTGAVDAFDYQAGLGDLYRTQEPSAVEVHLGPWEEYGQRLGSEFYPVRGEHWGAATVTPHGRFLFRPLTHVLRWGNPQRISLYAPEFATAGREHDWRRFARAYRGLPAAEPAPFDGTVTLRAPRPAVGAPVMPPDLLVRSYGDRVGVINDSAQARKVEIVPWRRPRPGERWVDLATGRTLARGTDRQDRFTLDLDAFDLRCLAIIAE